MNKSRMWAACAALMCVAISADAQHRHSQSCGGLKAAAIEKRAAKTTIADSREDNYDMKYVKMNLSMSNVTTAIEGDVTTMAMVTAPSMSEYVFELKPPLVVDSVLIDGVRQTADTSGTVCTVTLDAARSMGSMFTAQVFYHGTPVSSGSTFSKGITTLSSPSWGNWVTFTLSEPYSAADWWPCKQSLRDKIDSSDMWITVDDSLKAGSNGVLQAVTPMPGGRARYEWKHRYPIDYYLLSATVAKFSERSYYMHFTGSTDSMLIQNYIYDNPGIIPAFGPVIDSVGHQVDYFSTIYGRYPFWKEKYGHCMAPISGGMEHQTMTTQGFFQNWLVAHELGHQWFGNNVTCDSWSDIVVNEGFASYTEVLFLERFRTMAMARADMRDRQENVRTQPGGSVYVYDTTDENRIFDGRLSYDKGACVVHTLRHVINNDDQFFAFLRGWQETRSGGTGSVADMASLLKSMLTDNINGINVDTFFRQWFYAEGFPIYDVRWNQTGGKVIVKLNQTTSVPGSVANFQVPLQLRLLSATGDTIVRVNNMRAEETYTINWSKNMNGMEVDPNGWITDSITAVMRDMTLGAGTTMTTVAVVAPNPTTDAWTVSGLQVDASLQLTDIAGRVLWTGNAKNGMVTVPADNLSAGVYLLQISKTGIGNEVYRVQRK